jgi:hypothetical protein
LLWPPGRPEASYGRHTRVQVQGYCRSPRQRRFKVSNRSNVFAVDRPSAYRLCAICLLSLETNHVRLSDEERAKLIASSRKAAVAFLEDMAYLREVMEKPTDTAEVRRLSSILRRLLVDRDIQLVASPRVGKIKIGTPDNSAYYKAAKKREIRFFGSGGTKIFGRGLEAIFVWNMDYLGSFDVAARHSAQSAGLLEAALRKKIDLPLDSFSKQNVLYLNGRWISRAKAIKYVANIGSGVHSDRPKDLDEEILMQISHNNKYSYDKENDGFSFALGENPKKEFSYTPDSIDAVLVELLATARFLVESPDIINLEKIVEEELRSASSKT